MEQNDQDALSEEESESVRDSDMRTDEDSVDIISTNCGGEDFEKRNSSELTKNKFSIENILGLANNDVKCDEHTFDIKDEHGGTDNIKRIKCIKPTPISAAIRNTG